MIDMCIKNIIMKPHNFPWHVIEDVRNVSGGDVVCILRNKKQRRSHDNEVAGTWWMISLFYIYNFNFLNDCKRVRNVSGGDVVCIPGKKQTCSQIERLLEFDEWLQEILFL